MIPILGNPEFEPGLRNHLWVFLGPDGKLSPTALASDADPPLDFWSGLQLQHFIHQCVRVPGISRQLTELKCMCHKREPIRHSLSIIYAALTQPAPDFSLILGIRLCYAIC